MRRDWAVVLMILDRIAQGPPGSPPHALTYVVDGDILTITHQTTRFGEPDPETGERPVEVETETVDTFDFTGTPDGIVDWDTIETTLPAQPIVAAERIDGHLTVTVLDWSAA